jgi:two-component system, LytTR family, response regulator
MEKNMKCLVIDDNQMARFALLELIKDIPFLEVAGECDSAQCAFNCLEKMSIDLLFLDIEMPGISGMELLESLDRPPLTIFITSKRDYAVEAFDLRVVDYLVKPINPARFNAGVRRAKELFDQKNAQPFHVPTVDDLAAIFVRSENQLIKIAFDDLLFVSALGDYMIFQTISGKRHTVHSTMKAIEEALPATRFMRIHRSHIVHLEKIEAIGDGSSLLLQKHTLPVGEAFKTVLMQRLHFL